MLHQDLFPIIMMPSLDNFNVPQVRDLLQAKTMTHKNPASVRLFVSRHLLKMEQDGLLIAHGEGRYKSYSKSDLFFNSKIKATEKKQTKSKKATPKAEETKAGFINELKQLKSKLEAELAIKLAETEEYQSLMARFPDVHKQVRKLHKESMLQSATLTGQVTAVSKVLETTQGSPAEC